MGNELKKWRVTGPDGFHRIVTTADKEAERLALVFGVRDIHTSDLAKQAGYRAEPIEEPKMVTVRAEDLEYVLDCVLGQRVAGPRALDIRERFRAALDGAK